MPGLRNDSGCHYSVFLLPLQCEVDFSHIVTKESFVNFYPVVSATGWSLPSLEHLFMLLVADTDSTLATAAAAVHPVQPADWSIFLRQGRLHLAVAVDYR